MKLPNFYLFEPLNKLKEQMGLSRETVGDLTVTVPHARLTEAELEKLASQDGLDISIEDLVILSDGTLGYKNSRVLLYIRDIAVFDGREKEPRYHLSNCATLQGMRERNRFNSRYVVSTNVDGKFKLNLIDGRITRSKVVQLAVCQNCLGLLHFNGFRMEWRRAKRQSTVQTFKLEEFFSQYPRSLHSSMPKYNSDDAPVNNYPPDFDEISERTKTARNWKCEECVLDLSAKSHRKFLHTHHIDGGKSNNSAENLKVLCIGCHAAMPAHQHMKRLPEYNEFQRLRGGRDSGSKGREESRFWTGNTG
jgi:hypothetical protein